MSSEQTTSTDGIWVREGPLNTRGGHIAIYDPVRDRMVIFGGFSSSVGVLNDVWALSLTGSPAWTQLTPAGAPPSARDYHAAIYDPVRDRIVIFGGNNGSYVNDVWVLSLAGSPTWTQVNPVGTPPSARSWHTAIYDTLRDRMLVFGGDAGTNSLNDVWALSLAGSPAWTQLTPAGTPPSARYGHTAIYDPVRDRMVVFGGYGASSLNDVWALSLAGSPTWTQLTPTGTPPSARIWPTAIYDPVRDRIVVFGGYSTYALNDLWELSLAGGPAWTHLTPAGTPPSARYSHTAICDPVSDRMVVYGGYGPSQFNDVQALSLGGGPAWTGLTPAWPSARDGHTAIYDPVRDRTLVFGGENYSPVIQYNDVWGLSLGGGPAWTGLTPAGAPPSARSSHTAICDSARDRMVVFGGFGGFNPSPFSFNDVWALSLAGSPTWTQLMPAGTPPSARLGHSAIYDPVRDRMVLFGGRVYNGSWFNDVWALSLAGSPTWTQLTPAGTPPSARYGHTAIYDPARDLMVVFGGLLGSGYDLSDCWVLNSFAVLGVPPQAGGDALRLASAYPNPSHDDVSIGFELPHRSTATLRVYDLTGRVVRSLVDGSRPAGFQAVRWDRRVFSGALAQPGMYFYELRVDGHRLARRIVLIE